MQLRLWLARARLRSALLRWALLEPRLLYWRALCVPDRLGGCALRRAKRTQRAARYDSCAAGSSRSAAARVPQPLLGPRQLWCQRRLCAGPPRGLHRNAYLTHNPQLTLHSSQSAHNPHPVTRTSPLACATSHLRRPGTRVLLDSHFARVSGRRVRAGLGRDRLQQRTLSAKLPSARLLPGGSLRVRGLLGR